MNRDKLIERIIAVVGDNPHIPDEVKEDILGNLDGFEDDSLLEIIDIISNYNEKLAEKYGEIAVKLKELTHRSEDIAEKKKKGKDQLKMRFPKDGKYSLQLRQETIIKQKSKY